MNFSDKGVLTSDVGRVHSFVLHKDCQQPARMPYNYSCVVQAGVESADWPTQFATVLNALA